MAQSWWITQEFRGRHQIGLAFGGGASIGSVDDAASGLVKDVFQHQALLTPKLPTRDP
jgi:hypothetical protein